MHTPHSILVLMQIWMLPLKICVFSEQGDQKPVKMGGSGDPASQRASVAVSSELYTQRSFKASDLVQPHRVLQPRLDKSCPLSLHKAWTTNNTATLLGLDYYPNIPIFPK